MSVELKLVIAKNIAALRTAGGMTQIELAEKLNYSDKAVSKWERGESVPDVLTLMHLADQFGITVNDLVCDPNALPANSDSKLEKAIHTLRYCSCARKLKDYLRKR